MMTRAHVRRMFTESGYHVAKRVLVMRKARPEFFVLLEHLRKEQLRADAKEHAQATANECSPLYSVRESSWVD